MVCAVCGQEGARIRRVTRSYGKGATLLIIENVPVVSCPHCGTSYLTAQTYTTLTVSNGIATNWRASAL